MKKQDFYKSRNLRVTNDQGCFTYKSIPEMIADFNDAVNRETWARVYVSEDGTACVFVAHRFDWIGEMVERNLTPAEAEAYAGDLNKYFAICEEDIVEEL